MNSQLIASGIGIWIVVGIIWVGVLIVLKIYLDGRKQNHKPE